MQLFQLRVEPTTYRAYSLALLIILQLNYQCTYVILEGFLYFFVFNFKLELEEGLTD